MAQRQVPLAVTPELQQLAVASFSWHVHDVLTNNPLITNCSVTISLRLCFLVARGAWEGPAGWHWGREPWAAQAACSLKLRALPAGGCGGVLFLEDPSCQVCRKPPEAAPAPALSTGQGLALLPPGRTSTQTGGPPPPLLLSLLRLFL